MAASIPVRPKHCNYVNKVLVSVPFVYLIFFSLQRAWIVYERETQGERKTCMALVLTALSLAQHGVRDCLSPGSLRMMLHVRWCAHPTKNVPAKTTTKCASKVLTFLTAKVTIVFSPHIFPENLNNVLEKPPRWRPLAQSLNFLGLN